jgi:DNA polymerase I-like protein with 3'-5' exonuclease and polymerase domains
VIFKADASALEWRVKADLANDSVAIEEINNKIDQHTANQKQFGLPSRLIAKIFVYRMIFADAFGPKGVEGPAYAYSMDPDFSRVSSSRKYWCGVIEKFFTKYVGMYLHSVDCVRNGTRDGRIEIPTGRHYEFEPFMRRGQMEWPRTKLLNYPVQGFGADIMREIRLDFWRLMNSEKELSVFLPICTVHDDIEGDSPDDPIIIRKAGQYMDEAFFNVTGRLKEFYDYDLKVPMECEIKVGKTLQESTMISLDEYLGRVV